MAEKLGFLKKLNSFMKHTHIGSKARTDDAVVLWETGKNRYLIYKEPLDESARERSRIEGYLCKALEKKEFEVYYQPQIMVESGKISGFEALIRWNSPELGFMPPDRFIGIAEESKLIVPIGEWVLRTACAFIKGLHDKGHTGLTIAVNVSIVQLMQDGFAENVVDTLKELNLCPDCLELEITETILIESYERISKKLEYLKDLGVRIALDDFGRGYSSLSGLCLLPVSTLKIDKLFMDGILDDGPRKNITELIIQMGKKMGLMVLAEGIESKAQVDYLVKHKSIKAQGYYFSEPLPQRKAESLAIKRAARYSV